MLVSMENNYIAIQSLQILPVFVLSTKTVHVTVLVCICRTFNVLQPNFASLPY